VKSYDRNLVAALRLLRSDQGRHDAIKPPLGKRIPPQTVDELKQLGFKLNKSFDHDYSLTESCDALFPENIISWRKPEHEAKPVFVFENTTSTMDVAARHVSHTNNSSNYHGAVWAANSQSQGRGRMMRYWHSGPGLGCWFTISISTARLETTTLLPFAAALAVHDAIQKLLDKDTALKWPNDIIYDRKKVCGIIVERSPACDLCLVGIGLNVFHNATDFPEEIRNKSLSLSQIPGIRKDSLSRSRLIAEISDGILELTTQQWSRIRTRWCSKCIHLQEPVILVKSDAKICGTFHGVDDTGAIIIRENSGNLTTHHSGELHLQLAE